ncbi:LOW QUALITY PROTEIN: hypothetical protein RJ639_021035, partial [Escallonia herrerae]
GRLQNGQEIAVKRLSKGSGQGELEFKTKIFGKLQHKNLVRLLGFCLEKTERLLIYEFVFNPSLDIVLFGTVWQYWREGAGSNLIDLALKVDSGSIRDIIRCIHIGALCVQKDERLDRLWLQLFSCSVAPQSPSRCLQKLHFLCSLASIQNFHCLANIVWGLKIPVNQHVHLLIFDEMRLQFLS